MSKFIDVVSTSGENYCINVAHIVAVKDYKTFTLIYLTPFREDVPVTKTVLNEMSVPCVINSYTPLLGFIQTKVPFSQIVAEIKKH